MNISDIYIWPEYVQNAYIQPNEYVQYHSEYIQYDSSFKKLKTQANKQCICIGDQKCGEAEGINEYKIQATGNFQNGDGQGR